VTTAITVEGVNKRYGPAGTSVLALDNMSLVVDKGEFVCLVGASGCGKTTLLSLIVGLERPSSGTIEVTGGRSTLLFQESALFPWLTVGHNIELALRLRKIPRSDRAQRVKELVALVHLTGFEDKRPHELSGGMRQRGALARVLAQEAQIVLMDEPFAALDAMTRDSMHDEIERIAAELALTVMFVTHNVREAVRLSDRTVLMESGPGRVKDIYDIDLPRPRHFDDPHVAEMSGQLTGELKAEVARHVQ
jgi:NitT/TauT family transport system ATP-binding protein